MEDALSAGKLPVSPVPPELNQKPGTLLGPSATAAFEPVNPLGAVVYSDRPQFRWTALVGAKSYRVEVYSGDFELAARSASLQIERARTQPRGHLLAAVLLARAGLRDDALAELNAVDPETRGIPEVQRLLNPPPQ